MPIAQKMLLTMVTSQRRNIVKQFVFPRCGHLLIPGGHLHRGDTWLVGNC